MSTSRRKFLEVSMLAAAFAAAPAKAVLGQSWKERDANPGDSLTPQNDPLSNYSKAAFRSYLNSVFQLQAAFGTVEVTLTQVDDMPSPKNGECFALLFRGGSRPVRQDTYELTHPALGTFNLFLVPSRVDRNGAQAYTATVNRLSFGDMLNNPPPSRSARAKS
jgi:Domain of unknown function (DUF6916)